MTAFVDADADVFGFDVHSGSTPAFTQGGTDRYVFGGGGGVDFGGAPTISALKAGGSGGSDLVAILSDIAFYAAAGRFRVGDLVAGPGPGGTSDVYAAVSSGIQMAVAGAAYDGVDQTTPLNDATSNAGIEGGVSTTVASVAIPNVPSGEKGVAVLICASEVFAIQAFTAVGTAIIRAQALGGAGEELLGICVVEQERTGGTTGTVTIQINCNAGSAGALAWGIGGGWLLSAAGGGVPIAALARNANQLIEA